jgi:hypothetical protein
MSHPEAKISALEAEAGRNRAALAASVTAAAIRLKPAHLIEAAIDKAGKKTSGLTRDVASVLTDKGGKAALLGAGALLAFDLGRRASKPAGSSLDGRGDAGTSPEPIVTPRPAASRFGSIKNLPDLVKFGGGGVVAIMAGYGVANLIPVSPAERQWLGDLPAEAKARIKAFQFEHTEGEKQLVAQSFGIAKLVAAALSVMAVLARLISTHTPEKAR